ncbi:N-acetyl-gamma-glutamyl-phosphate reductase [Posidoniimonas polymericola]|uniref:N-acetyl-gamma-glutamyl-phosphate reductase n=1 Tax=Posidoniimonas polymericola TaxID=2528002 RepID=A0A5C5YQ27_9BACT|nr:N-acetyl-gamma-glutamyl-phosphate reductase [Posidoniimonas polymericola]TWT76939.1 N-acetyl-gamma-glutamyl-phosphate reductase [Posidoniimonas polymericola]
MARVAIIGASGYTGLELLRLFARHPGMEVTALVTRQTDAPYVADVHPSLRGAFDLRLEALSLAEIGERADYAFACLPHAASAALIAQLLDAGLKVVDLSADYRLTSREVYEQWYKVTHPDPDRIGKVAYGLPELYRSRIRESELVANPGCYPTSAILALAPLLKAGLVSAEGIIVDSKSGVSGAGRDPKPAFHFPECNESFAAYGVGTHRHMPEIDQVLTDAAGQGVEVLFTPHLVPMDRGILSTSYATLADGVDQNKLMDALRDFYRDEPFVQVIDGLPATKHVAGTNNCHITARVARGRAVVVSVIDNLIKGAAGAAVQNFNLMSGQDETLGLT